LTGICIGITVSALSTGQEDEMTKELTEKLIRDTCDLVQQQLDLIRNEPELWYQARMLSVAGALGSSAAKEIKAKMMRDLNMLNEDVTDDGFFVGSVGHSDIELEQQLQLKVNEVAAEITKMPAVVNSAMV
jgi:hypothetical protein